MQRRGFILGLASGLAAPAIVRAEALMKVAALRAPVPDFLDLGNGEGMEFLVTRVDIEYGAMWIPPHWRELICDSLQPLVSGLLSSSSPMAASNMGFIHD